ncbi:MAG: hypothetical protein GWP91_11125 [Rhodobacterales bacterium]|nr:hypothetical protein [Rhodobacterales bacterium]
MLAYRGIQQVLTAAMSVFFKDIQRVGQHHIPLEGAGPVLFVGNHPNSLIDPVLLVTTCDRIVHFAAKDKLFTFPLSVLLRTMGAVPIARKMDYVDGGERDNLSAFEAMYQVLGGGRAVGIFPEGLSHDKAQLQRIKSGAARVALETATRHPDVPLVIVPCGLNYIHKKTFRSRVLIQYGEPIQLGESERKAWSDDERASAAELTERIEDAMRSLTVNAEDWETLRVLDACRRLYQPRHVDLAQRVELARRFCDVYPQIRDQRDVQVLYAKVRDYLDTLDASGLNDRDLLRDLSVPELSARALGNVLRLVFWAPLALPGLPIHGSLLVGVGWAGVQFSPRNDVVGTSRFVIGLLAVVAAWVLVPILAGLQFGLKVGVAVGISLPVAGFATLKVLERGASLRRLLRSALHALALRKTLGRLREQRKSLEQEVITMVQRRIPDDMKPIFPGRLER